MPFHLSKATRADLPDLVKLLHEEMYPEIGEVPVNYEKGVEYVTAHVEKSIVFLVRYEGKLIGTLGLEHQLYWYSDKGYFCDAFFYVTKEHRKGQATQMLMTAAKDVARRTNIPCKIVVVNPDRAKSRLKPIYGFEPNGYFMEI